MALRAIVRTDKANRYALTTAGALAAGVEVKFGADDLTCVASAAGTATDDELTIGWTEVAAKAGDLARILLNGFFIIKVIVGTGGATRGLEAVRVSTGGYTNAPANTAGLTSKILIKGRFMQSGIAGDEVGMLVHSYRAISS